MRRDFNKMRGRIGAIAVMVLALSALALYLYSKRAAPPERPTGDKRLVPQRLEPDGEVWRLPEASDPRYRPYRALFDRLGSTELAELFERYEPARAEIHSLSTQKKAVQMKHVVITFLVALLLGGCAGSPFNTGGREVAELKPGEAREQPEARGANVIWGGRIVGVVNAGERTEIEVLSLPLGSGDRPRRERDGGARFVIHHRGFLEPMTYAPGRHVTAFGRFVGIESRSVGAFPLDHPVLEAEQIELWPVETNSSRGGLELGAHERF